jgi:hypothetical protein
MQETLLTIADFDAFWRDNEEALSEYMTKDEALRLARKGILMAGGGAGVLFRVSLETKANKFVIGETYTCRSACDHATIFAWKVVARTDKILTLEQYGKTEKRGVRIGDDGIERCRPSGRYSMAPVISADRRGEC